MDRRTQILLRRLTLAGSLAAAAIPRAQSTSPTNPTASFEVAAIRATGDDPDADMNWEFLPGGRLQARNVTLEWIVMQAYGVQSFQVDGGPQWIRETTFDIDAKAPEDSIAAQPDPADKEALREAQRAMLRSLLVERFHLTCHRETREGPVFDLTRSGRPLLLTPPRDPKRPGTVSNPGGGWGGISNGRGLQGRNITMDALAARLTRSVNHPVQNHTGLNGAWDFSYSTGANDPDASNLMTIELSLDKVGLKLRRARGPVSTIVVDAVEKPTPN